MGYGTADPWYADERRVERVYGVLARVYDDFFDWALGPGRRRAVSGLEVGRGERILEVGVGTGLSLPIYPRDSQVTGIDISDAMLKRARGRLRGLGRDGVELRRMDAHELAFADASFDHVVAPYVISVVRDPRRVMSEIARVVRPGGSVTVVNHFSLGRPFAPLERLATPLTQWIGFRLDVEADVVTAADGLSLASMERVNFLGLWKLIRMRRR